MLSASFFIATSLLIISTAHHRQKEVVSSHMRRGGDYVSADGRRGLPNVHVPYGCKHIIHLCKTMDY